MFVVLRRRTRGMSVVLFLQVDGYFDSLLASVVKLMALPLRVGGPSSSYVTKLGALNDTCKDTLTPKSNIILQIKVKVNCV